MAIGNVFEQDKWTWGISDDIFVWIPNSCADIYWCEVRSNPKSIKLWYTNKLDTGVLVPTGYFHCWLAVSDWKTLMFSNTWQIYINISGTRTLAYTHSGSAPILGCAEYNGYVYYATATKLHRVLLATLASTFTPTNIDWATFTAGDTTNHPMISTNLYLYIGDGKYVASVQSTVFTAATLTLPTGETVYQMTDNGASIRLYTRHWSKDEATCYFWDGVSAAVEQTQSIPEKIQNVVTKDNVDYAIMGADPILYFYPYQKQPLKRLSGFTHYPNNMVVHKWYILFCWSFDVAGDTVGGVMKRGNYTKDYPEVLTKETGTSNWAWEVTCIVNNWGTLYSARKDWSTFWIDKLSTTEYNAYWFFDTRASYWENIWKKKTGIDVYITHQPLATGEQILVYWIIDDTWVASWLYSLEWPTTSMVSKFKANIPFNFIQLKVEIYWASPYTTTPEIYNVYFRSEQMQ